jgi:hypothetical protein
MGHPANEAVIVDLISQWAAIALHRLANHLQMGPTALPRHQQRPDHPPGVIILGQEEVLLAPQRRQPTVPGGIVLEEDAGARHLKAHIDLALLSRSLVISAMMQDTAMDAVARKGTAKNACGLPRPTGQSYTCVGRAGPRRGYSATAHARTAAPQMETYAGLCAPPHTAPRAPLRRDCRECRSNRNKRARLIPSISHAWASES